MGALRKVPSKNQCPQPCSVFRLFSVEKMSTHMLFAPELQRRKFCPSVVFWHSSVMSISAGVSGLQLDFLC